MSGAATLHRVFVNDRAREVPAETVLANLIRELGLADRKGVAAAVNGAVVPRGAWAGRGLQPDDRVLVIQATQGG